MQDLDPSIAEIDHVAFVDKTGRLTTHCGEGIGVECR